MSLQNERLLASYLRHLLVHLREHNQGSLSYYDVTRSKSREALKRTIDSTFQDGGVAQGKEYVALLLKKVMLVSFEVLCASLELVQEVEYSYSEFKDILLSVEHFNNTNSDNTHTHVHMRASYLSTKRTACWHIELSSLVEAHLMSRVHFLASALFNRPSPDSLLHLVQFEQIFSRALLAMIATYTSLLNVTDRKMQQRRQFVSAEVFSMHSLLDEVTWSDCLIPGAQSETLRTAGIDILSRLWSRVADELISRAQPLLSGSSTMEKSVPWLHRVSRNPDLAKFPGVTSCLNHVLSTYLRQQSLAEWDEAFQQCLASDSAKYRKCYRVAASDNSSAPASFCSSSLDEYMRHEQQGKELNHHSPGSIISHVNILRRTLPLSYALNASLNHTAFTLIQNLSSSMSWWNLASLAWLLFKEIPLTRCSVSNSMALSYGAVSPRLSFPAYSGLHSLECTCRTVCSSLHKTSTYLQETLEDFYKHFQSMWACQCSQLLKSTFPKVKHWKNIRHKGQYRIEQSRYCDVLIEHLLFPVIDAAVSLPEGEQACFLYLMTAVFWGEYRKTITCNKRLYSIYSGRQLLTDYRYIQKWLTSSDQQLSNGALQVLSKLPISKEIERGLLTICGTADMDQTDSAVGLSSTAEGPHQQVLLLSHNFLVLNEMAWNTLKDWEECVA